MQLHHPHSLQRKNENKLAKPSKRETKGQKVTNEQTFIFIGNIKSVGLCSWTCPLPHPKNTIRYTPHGAAVTTNNYHHIISRAHRQDEGCRTLPSHPTKCEKPRRRLENNHQVKGGSVTERPEHVIHSAASNLPRRTPTTTERVLFFMFSNKHVARVCLTCEPPGCVSVKIENGTTFSPATRWKRREKTQNTQERKIGRKHDTRAHQIFFDEKGVLD